MTPTRLKLRFAQWASMQAGRVCAWAYEVENAAMNDLPKCVDCHQPEPLCYCGVKADEQAAHDDIYRSGFEAGQRDMYR